MMYDSMIAAMARALTKRATERWRAVVGRNLSETYPRDLIIRQKIGLTWGHNQEPLGPN
jgi:hypothetical protein